jgi:predicted alpha/beta superfamily hydrolase
MAIVRHIHLKSTCLIVLTFMGWTAVLCSAQSIIPAGQQITIHSEILGEDRAVFVALPASYRGSGTERFPVLYLTDAQWNFAHAWTTTQLLARNVIIPEMIVVGVVNRDRTRDLYATRADFRDGDRVIPFPTSGNADQFLEFVAKELIPWTEKTYRTSELRVLAGHSAGGNFALHAIRLKPELFQAVIATSPWLTWDDRKELNQLLPFVRSTQLRLRALFFSWANEGAEMKADVDALTAALTSRVGASLRWRSVHYPDETHDSTVIKSYYDGLRMIFAGYNYPRDAKTYQLVGSLDDVKSYFAKLGEQVGVPLGPPEPIVYELGYQYLQAGRSELAVAAFRFNTEQHPQSATAWDSLAEGLERRGEVAEALASYRKAVALEEAQQLPNVEAFRSHLSRLEATRK